MKVRGNLTLKNRENGTKTEPKISGSWTTVTDISVWQPSTATCTIFDKIPQHPHWLQTYMFSNFQQQQVWYWPTTTTSHWLHQLLSNRWRYNNWVSFIYFQNLFLYLVVNFCFSTNDTKLDRIWIENSNNKNKTRNIITSNYLSQRTTTLKCREIE
jgi:hypothetical protein